VTLRDRARPRAPVFMRYETAIFLAAALAIGLFGMWWIRRRLG
jgi:hypothetical protein